MQKKQPEMRGKEIISKGGRTGTRRGYFLLYTCLYVFMTVSVFGVFFVNGKSFIWVNDGWKQTFQALQYYAKWLRDIAEKLFFEHQLEIPRFSFSLGYGSDIVTTLHYYVIGDPFSFLAVFVPIRYMAYFYGTMILLRLYLAGVAFSIYCFHMMDKTDGSERSELPSDAGVLAGAFVYVFCGFALHASVRHPFFVNPMIWFPLILTGAEKILEGKSPLFMSFFVCLAAFSNFYFFYMIAILTALYVTGRLIMHTVKCRNLRVRPYLPGTAADRRKGHSLIRSSGSGQNIRETFGLLAKITASSFLGTCMAAVLLFPVILCFLGDARTDNNLVIAAFYSVGEYESNFGNFLSAVNTHHWLWLGYAGIALPELVLLFLQKRNRGVKAAFLVLTAVALLPAAGSALNGFSYVSNRWVWGYSFLIAGVVVLKWNALFQMSAEEKWKLSLCMAVYFLICMGMEKSRTASAFFGIGMALLLMMSAVAVKERYGLKWAQRILIFFVLMNLAGNAYFKYSPEEGDYVSQFVDMDQIEAKMSDTEVEAVKTVSAGETGFFRYSGAGLSKNASLCGGTHTTQFYWSLSNGNVAAARGDAAFSEEISAYNYRSMESRTFLLALANVKYVVNDKKPFGYKNAARVNGYRISENDCFLPFGYTYDSYITRDEYEAMSPLEKQEAMLQGVVIDGTKAQGQKTELFFTGESLPFDAEAGDGVTITDHGIKVTKKNAVMTLTFEGLANSETYVYVKGFSYSGYSPGKRNGGKENRALSAYARKRVRRREKYWKEDTRITVKLTADGMDGGSSGELNYFTPHYLWYGNRDDFMVNLGYEENARTTITLTFTKTGDYSFDSLEVLCQPMDHYTEQIAALGEEVMENVDFHETDRNATDQVTGTIRLENAKYLLLTIPYSAGWTAYVDGAEQELLRANTMYSALYLEAGEHEIILAYHTPGLAAGAMVSVVAVAIFLLMAVKRKRFGGRTPLQKEVL
ncbi:MAG: YfhO family protein [Clostridiales bacterium]|nr:YfhO family protein [Clostridiales bacterium]